MRAAIRERIGSTVILVFLSIVTLLTLYPVWYVVMYSVSAPGEAMDGGAFLFPQGLSLVGFRYMLNSGNVYRAYGNSVFRLMAGTITNVALTASLAYPLSRRRFYGRNTLSFIIFFTMLFNGGMIPLYLLVRTLGLLDSLWALIIPTAISAYNFFIMKNYFQSVPKELEESALIDGAGPGRVLAQVFLPVAKPVIAAIALFYAVYHWNEYFTGVLYINSQEKEILQLFLRRLFSSSAVSGIDSSYSTALGEMSALTENTMRMVAIMVSLIPMMILYPFIQKHYVKGLMIGSIKG
jgi:putative aldouronate transport system permease protein